jgi:hypothetical protein
MKYLAAYFLAQLGGNDAPTADDVTKILAAGEIDVDAEEVSRLLAAVEGKVRRKRETPPLPPLRGGPRRPLRRHRSPRTSPSPPLPHTRTHTRARSLKREKNNRTSPP